MTFGFSDSEAMWPEGEFISLMPETERDAETIGQLGNFAVKHGWSALVCRGGNDKVSKMFLIPKAAKPTNNQP